MSNETASLVIVVDSTGVAAATAQLDAMAAAGARAEAATSALGSSSAASALSGVASALSDAGAAMASVGAAGSEAGTKVVASTTAMGESAAAATARIKAMVAASLEQASANEGIAESEVSLAERAGARIEATAAQIAATQAAIAAQDAQMVSMDAYAGAEQAATVATTELTVAKEEQAASFALNSRAMNEVSTITTDLVTGQYGRMRRSIAALANASGAVKALFSGMGVAAIAIGAVAVAAYKGEEAESALNNALISTGNYAGVTTDQLNAMAQSMAGGTVTIGHAREAVAALTESGRFSGDQIAKLAQATVDAGNLMGQSVKEVVTDFTRLQESPVAASEKLNQSMHYLTTTVLQQIQALQQQGDTIGAADLAMNAYADTLRTRTAESEKQLGTLQRAWDSVKSSASFAWDAMMGIGRPTSDLGKMQQQYDALLKERTAVGDVASGHKPGLIGGSYLPAGLSGADGSWGMFSSGPTDAAIAKANTLLPALDAQLAQMRSAMKPLEDAASGKASAARVAQDVQAAGTQGVETLTKLGISLDGVKSKTDKVAAAAAALYAIHLAGGKLPAGVDFNGPAADIPEGAGWNKIKDQLLHGTRQRKNPEVSAFSTFQSQVDALDVKSITSGDSALTTYEQGIARLADQMEVYMKKGGDATKAAALFNRGQQDLQKTLDLTRAKQDEADAAFDAAYAKKSQALQRSINDQVNAIGMGAKEAQRTQEITKAYQDEADALANLALQRQKGQRGESGGITQAQYEHDVATVKAATNANVATMQDGFRRVDAAQGSWLNGAAMAFQNYIDQGANVANQTDRLFTNAFTSMGNALATFATTGKFNFRSLTTSILTDLARMEVRILESKVLDTLLGAFSGGGSGGSTWGGYIGGNGTGGYGMQLQSANGNAFDNVPGLSRYSGSVVSSPTPFLFASGAGIMGEAGPEAILPLRRGPDGKLGVASGGGGASPTVNISIAVDNSGNATQQSSGDTNALAAQFAERMKTMSRQTIAEEQRPGGLLWRMQNA